MVTINEHGAGQFPHEGACVECRKLMRCNACGVPIYAGLNARPGRSARCTNGRCTECHHKFCTLGGSPSHLGHGFWQKSTKPKHLIRYPETRKNCEGSGQDAGPTAAPGVQEKPCQVCGRWILVKRDGKLRVHRGKVEEKR